MHVYGMIVSVHDGLFVPPIVGTDDVVMHVGTVVSDHDGLHIRATVGTDDAVTQFGIIVSVRLELSARVDVLDAVLLCGVTVSVNPIAEVGTLDAVVQCGMVVCVQLTDSPTVGTLLAVVHAGTVVWVRFELLAMVGGVVDTVMHAGIVVSVQLGLLIRQTVGTNDAMTQVGTVVSVRAIAGAGTRDAASIYFFSLVGVSKAIALSLSLINLASSILISLIGGIFYVGVYHNMVQNKALHPVPVKTV